MVELKQEHWVVAKHVLRYLKGIVEYVPRYLGDGEMKLQGYYSDWAGSIADRKSTSRCCFSLCSTMISWFSRKQTAAALSIVEVEYMAANTASCESIWLRKLLARLFGFASYLQDCLIKSWIP
jgi:hypothetical protein